MANGTWGGPTDIRPLQVKIQWLAGTATQQTGFHLRAATANLADPQEAANAVLQWVTQHFRVLLLATQRIQLIDVVDLYNKEGFSLAPANLFGTNGAPAANRAPGFIAVTVTMKSSKRQREGQGRMFWPVVDEASSEGDVLETNSAVGFQAVVDGLATAFIGNQVTGYDLINLHAAKPERPRKRGGPLLPAQPARWFDVVSLRLNPAVTALRSRKAGVGS